jgi:DNA-binding transcriptional MocR family regulator
MVKQTSSGSELNFRYILLADEIESKITGGDYKAGEKLPSLRKLHQQLGLSISTVYQAYIELEKRGAIESRLKSGFYVKALLHKMLPQPRLTGQKAIRKKVTVNSLAIEVLDSLHDDEILQLGAAVPAVDLMPVKQLSRLIKSIPARKFEDFLINYERPAGTAILRRQIAKRMLTGIKGVKPEDIITTNGCMDAVGLCLRAIAKPGDTILVESPTFHCFLQLIEDLGMFALEVPSDPVVGVNPEALKKALREHDVKSCLFIPNFQNPLGSLIPVQQKKELVDLLNRKNIPIIEDDIYGDLYFEKTRPPSLRSFDRKGMVLYCSSFSKTLSPGLRVGWTIPGRFVDTVKRLKLNTCLATPELNQFAVAEFIKTGSYDRHLRKLRNALKNQMSNTLRAIARYFPKGTKVNVPKGGIVLWVQLNPSVNGMDVYHEALKRKISILPGAICSVSKKYKNYIRLSCGHPWSDRLEKGFRDLGAIIQRLNRMHS